MDIRKITHSYRKCRSGFPTAMIETGKSSYAKASEDNNPTEPLCVGGSLLHIQEIHFQITKIIGKVSCLTRKTTGGPSWLTTLNDTRQDASPIEASSVVCLCSNFPISSAYTHAPMLLHLRKSYVKQELQCTRVSVDKYFRNFGFLSFLSSTFAEGL